MVARVLFTIFVVLWTVAVVRALLGAGIFATTALSFLFCLSAAIVFMSLVFLIARRIGRYDIVDAAWGLCFIVVVAMSFTLQNRAWFELDAGLIATILVLIWGLRLSLHIVRRISSTESEDARYIELRKSWKGNVAYNVYTRVYLLQAVLATFVSIPVIYVNLFGTPYDATQSFASVTIWSLGLVIWFIGYAFEVIGDDQLRKFMANKNNKGKLLTGGLWKYTRHPNYFGEVTQWWGIFIICLSVPLGWIGIIGPALISYLILFVSGVPLSERRFEGRPGWSDYKTRTSAFLPLPPRR